MASLYSDIADHPYLTPMVLAIGGAKLKQEQILAERLLGLNTPVFTDARDVEEVLLAIAIQINFQVAEGIDPFYKKAASSSQSKTSVVYRDNVMLDPRAADIIADLKARAGIDTLDDRFGNLVSLRTNDDASR